MAQYYILTAFMVAIAVAQSPPNSICLWRDARSGVVRDTLYIEGGLKGIMLKKPVILTQQAGLSRFNFSSSFDQKSNFTDLFRTENIIQDRDPMLKTHIGGYMFADGDEWYAFGGRAFPIANNLSTDTSIIRDALYSPNYLATNPSLGISTNIKANTNNSTTLYITNGAGVSIPGENLGFYFSGLHSYNNSHLSYLASPNSSEYPSVLSNSMLRVNTQSFGSSAWSQLPLPSNIAPRSEAVLAWIPAGRRGAIVVIGGVPFPASLASSCTLNDTTMALNNAQAPAYMSSLPVYDIAGETWYLQTTSGPTPPQLAQACAVVASSSNNSVHNIHVYGGYNGVDKTSASDDVWILSVPSFTWIKVPSIDQSHGRSSHVCATPYPDQMMVVGGTTNCNSYLETSAFADVFNLNNLTWTGTYDPVKWSDYSVPSLISNAIQARPTASMEDGLLAVFKTAYPGTIQTWYPYKSIKDNSTSYDPPSNPPQATPYLKWLIPVIVVAVLFLLVIIGTLGWCHRKRGRYARRKRSRRSITQWIRGQPVQEKSVNSDDETQVNSTYGIHEATGDQYFRKPEGRDHAAELNSSSRGDSIFDNTLGSPQGVMSPSSRDTAELYTPAARHELDNRYDANHKARLSGMGNYTTNSYTKRGLSMTMDHNAVYELPQNRSDEDVVAPSQNATTPDRDTPRASTFSIPSPATGTAPLAGSISPNITSATISPTQKPLRVPITPPHMTFDTTRPKHTRNISSLSSGLPDLGSPSVQEDQRRSQQIASLPDLPTTPTRDLDTNRHPGPIVITNTVPVDGSHDTAPNQSLALRRSLSHGVMSHGAQRTVNIVRRKELPPSARVYESGILGRGRGQEALNDANVR